MNFLEKRIIGEPYNIKKDNIGNLKKSVLSRADHFLYIENRSYKGMGYHWAGLISFIICFAIFRPYNGGWSLLIFCLLGGISLFIFIYNYIAPNKEMVYDREKGVITLDQSFRKSINVPFSTGVASKVYYSATEGLINSQLVFFSSAKKPRRRGLLSEHHLDEFWNFTVWYMDKNRPLPPGSAFDPYRDKDFERRKTEGFPKPLYPSNIPTPEATKAQQAERKRIAGW